MLQVISQGGGGPGFAGLFALGNEGGSYLVEAAAVDVLGVIGCLVEEVEGDQDTAGEAEGQAEDIDEGEDLIFLEAAPGDQEVITEHSNWVDMGMRMHRQCHFFICLGIRFLGGFAEGEAFGFNTGMFGCGHFLFSIFIGNE
jgi:hypothetical protein